MWGSTTPGAIAGLMSALTAALAPDDVRVVDGPNVGTGYSEVITVGWTGEEGAESVTGTLASGGLSLIPDRETYTIHCAAMALRGSGAIADARTRAYELLAVVGAELAADKTLGGAVMTARLGEVALTQQQMQRGALATVTFGVDVDAFTKG